MKVQVNVKTLAGDLVKLDLVVEPTDTVTEIKRRIAQVEPNPFPATRLSVGDAIMQDADTVEDRVADGSVLDFEADVSETAVADQLDEMLAASGSMAVDELAMMYSFKHGMPVGSVLHVFGHGDTLATFLERFGKRFAVASGKVSREAKMGTKLTRKPLGLIPEDSVLQVLTVAIVIEVHATCGAFRRPPFDLKVPVSDSGASARRRICEASQVPFGDSELLKDGSVLPNDVAIIESGVHEGDMLVFSVRASEQELSNDLAGLVRGFGGAASQVDLENAYCLSRGASTKQALELLGWEEPLASFLQRQEAFAVKGGSVRLVEGDGFCGATSCSQANSKCLEISRGLLDDQAIKKLASDLAALGGIIADTSFLDIDRVVSAGAVAKGLSISGDIGAELVVFVNGLEVADWARCLPGIAASFAAVAGETLVGSMGIETAQCVGSVVVLRTSGALGEVLVRFSPAYASYGDALAAMRTQPAAMHHESGAASLSPQDVRFVAKQPAGVKATIRLMRWWRAQQQWSSARAKPTDALLELVVVYCALQMAPADLATALEDVCDMIAHLDDVAMSWPASKRSYATCELSQTVCDQRPLLLSPVNPLVNLLSADAFDCSEVAQRAGKGFFAA